jgi:hypothetical protein
VTDQQPISGEPVADDFRLTPLWQSVRAEVDRAVDTILEELFTATRRSAANELSAAEEESLARMELLEIREGGLREEIARLAAELAGVRAELEAERVRSGYRMRVAQELEDIRSRARRDPALASDADRLTSAAIEQPVAATGTNGTKGTNGTNGTHEPRRTRLVVTNVPTFRAALGVERSIEALPSVGAVHVIDFERRRLEVDVEHDDHAAIDELLRSERPGQFDPDSSESGLALRLNA